MSMLERWAAEIRCELLHKDAECIQAEFTDARFRVIRCRECDRALATRINGHEPDLSQECPDHVTCRDFAMHLAYTADLSSDTKLAVLALGERAELAERERKRAVYTLAKCAALALCAALLALMCLLSGCLTPAKLAAWSTEAATISQASTDPKCVESALTLQSAIVRALDTQKTATQYMDGATAPDVDRARDEMMTACGVKR